MCSAALCTSSAERIFYISRLSRPAGRSKRIFTGGVVTANGSCSAAFCESAALREASSPSQSPTVTALPKGEPLAVHANFISLPRPLPLGEVASRSDDGEGEDADLVLRFLRKTKHRSIRRRSGVPESNYFFAYSSPICWAYSSSSSRSRKGVLTPSRSR